MADRGVLTLEEFRALYPWPAELLRHGRPVEELWTFELQVAPAVVWPVIADNSRLARAAGGPEMEFEPTPEGLIGHASHGGVEHEWLEAPWQWVREREFVFARHYRRGLQHDLRCVERLEATAGGSRLTIYYGMIPRGLVGRVFARLGLASLRKGFARAVAELGGELGQPGAAVLPRAAPPLDEAARHRLRELRGRLVADGQPAAIVDHLCEFVATADELDALRMQVRRLARSWRLETRALLEVCLHATRAGLLALSWDVVCPHCRGVLAEVGTLAALPGRAACPACAIEFGTDRAHAIEITFRIHPSLRKVQPAAYCLAEAARKGHVHVQQCVPAGAARKLTTQLPAGSYRVRGDGDRVALLEVVAGAPRELTVGPAGPERLEVGPAPELALVAGERDTTWVIEETAWSDDAMAPVELFNCQEFRDLFAEQYLGAEIQLHVGEQTLLFTDIVGSTVFYTAVGDPVAFVEVKKHFAAIFAVVAAHDGAVVKTIGDAVMAAFSNPLDAVRAAVAIHRGFPGGEGAPPVRLRVSLNTGPCIAVNLNSGIDYFGSTVNAAAKLQACAGAGQIALSETVRRAPGVMAYLEGLGVPLAAETLAHEAFGTLAVTVLAPTAATRPADRTAPPARRPASDAREPAP